MGFFKDIREHLERLKELEIKYFGYDVNDMELIGE